VRSLGPYLSVVFGAGALLVVLFFYRRHDKRVEQLGKMGGIVAGAIAVVKYDQVIAIVMKLMGSGSSLISFVVVGMASIASIVALRTGLMIVRRRKAKPPTAA